jgi:hypothetical protein
LLALRHLQRRVQIARVIPRQRRRLRSRPRF